MRLVFFDLDGTLLRGASSERRFMLYLLRRGWVGPLQLTAQSLFLMRYAPAFGRHVLKKDKAYLTRLHCDRVVAVAAEFVTTHLVPKLFAPALDCLRAHRAAGDRIVLLTGTPDFIARPLASYLRVEEVHATLCASRNGRFVAKPPLQHPFAADKLRIARQIAADAGASLDEASAYADSAYDLALLQAVSVPVAVCPAQKLRAKALARGWRILEAVSAHPGMEEG